MDEFDDIYDTLMGELLPEAAIPGVPNLFAPGSECDRAYAAALDAYYRLLDRLGRQNDDPDVEIIFNAFLQICRTVGREIYRLGKQSSMM